MEEINNVRVIICLLDFLGEVRPPRTLYASNTHILGVRRKLGIQSSMFVFEWLVS
jgi:hypothetical protein